MFQKKTKFLFLTFSYVYYSPGDSSLSKLNFSDIFFAMNWYESYKNPDFVWGWMRVNALISLSFLKTSVGITSNFISEYQQDGKLKNF